MGKDCPWHVFFTVLLILSIPAVLSGHGKRHVHGIRGETDADRANAANVRLRAVHASILDSFTHHQLHYAHAQTADKFRLYHDENGRDGSAYLRDLLTLDEARQHYRHNLVHQTVSEGARMAYGRGYMLRKVGAFSLTVAAASGFRRERMRDAGRLLMKPNGKLVRNALFDIGTRISPLDISTGPDEMAIDIHVHTLSSFDGMASLESLLLQAAKGGLDGVAITDHDSFAEAHGAERVAKRLKAEGRLPESFLLIPGEEVSTADGHVLALFISRKIPSGLSAARTIAEIHRQGGLAVAPHPMEPDFGLGRHLVKSLPLDGMVVTGASPGELYRCAQLAAEVKGRMALFMDTDAHMEDGAGWAGYTVVSTQDGSPEGVKQAIRAGRTRPVHRGVLQAMLQTLERPVPNVWFGAWARLSDQKLALEDRLASLFRLREVELVTALDAPVREFLDIWSLYNGLAPRRLRRLPFLREVIVASGGVRLALGLGPEKSVRFRYRFANIP